MVSVFPASEKFDSDLELDAGMYKTDAHPWPPINIKIAPMPTQNPWAWAWACLKEIELRLRILMIVLHSNNERNWEDLCI